MRKQKNWVPLGGGGAPAAFHWIRQCPHIQYFISLFMDKERGVTDWGRVVRRGCCYSSPDHLPYNHHLVMFSCLNLKIPPSLLSGNTLSTYCQHQKVLG